MMVTIVIDEGTIIAIAIPFVIIAFLMLFFAYTETKSELECEQYRDTYMEYRQKELQKNMTMEEDHVKH